MVEMGKGDGEGEGHTCRGRPDQAEHSQHPTLYPPASCCLVGGKAPKHHRARQAGQACSQLNDYCRTAGPWQPTTMVHAASTVYVCECESV